MKNEVGLWIDNMKSVIVTVLGETEEIRQVKSNIEKHVHFAGGSHAMPLYGTSSISGESKQALNFKNYLAPYYDDVVTLIRNADSIWIFGPGEAKREVEKRLMRDEPGVRIDGIESAEKMTDRQIVAKVREHYLR
jgi:hypothetical protein